MSDRNGGRWWDRWGNAVLWTFGAIGVLLGLLYADLRDDIATIRHDVERLEGKVNEIHRWTKPAEGLTVNEAPLGKPQS